MRDPGNVFFIVYIKIIGRPGAVRYCCWLKRFEVVERVRSKVVLLLTQENRMSGLS